MSGPPDGDEAPGELEQLLVFRQQLSPKLWLVVGDDIGRLHQLGDEFLRVFGIGVLLALTLAVAGGAVVSMTFLQRVDSINRTAEARSSKATSASGSCSTDPATTWTGSRRR